MFKSRRNLNSDRQIQSLKCANHYTTGPGDKIGRGGLNFWFDFYKIICLVSSICYIAVLK